MKSRPKYKPVLSEDIVLPLYNLFKSVKRLDEETGHATVDNQSYFILLQTLRKGYMLLSKESILLLCEKLWIKPYHLKSGGLSREKLKQLLEDALQAFSSAIEHPATPLEAPVAPGTGKKPKRGATSKLNMPQQEAPPPTAMDLAISQEQGTLSIYVDDAVDGDAEGSASATDEVDRFVDKSFFVKGSYLPINPRRIEQSVRLYRNRLKGVRNWEPDWPGTIQDISKRGYFDSIILQEKDAFSSNFTVLIDHSASMAAFEAYSEEIARAVAKDSVKDYEEIFYFKNYPGTQLYFDRMQLGSVSFDEFSKESKKSILVISDAGAARGSYNEERIRATLRFLRRLQKHRVAWMNPMPQSRWRNTSADMIAEYVNMFDIGEGSTDGLSNIVRLFKSKIQTGKM